MTPRQLAQCARAEFRKAANPQIAARQRTYFKKWEKVLFYGVMTPDLRNIEHTLYPHVRKDWSYADGIAFCELLIRDRYMESKSLGLTLLARYHRRFEEDLLRPVHIWLERGLCDNWAVTDQLSTQIVSGLIDKFPPLAATVESWSRSPNLWVRRASAVSFVKPAGKGRHLDRAYRVVMVLQRDPHDLIHKATGWLLREAGKADAGRLERYLLRYGAVIPRTAIRYAIERFPERQRRRILQITRAKSKSHPR